VFFRLWPQAKKPWLFGFGTGAKAKPKFWPELACDLAWQLLGPKPEFAPSAPIKVCLLAFRPKPGLDLAWLLAWPEIFQGQSQMKPGQSHGFQSQGQKITSGQCL